MMLSQTRLAIVGSRSLTSEGAKTAQVHVESVIGSVYPSVVISGGAPGVDLIAEAEARARGVQTRIFLPKNPRWDPDGYKARNIKIAEDCTALLLIQSSISESYGSGWTADYAEKIGKTVWRVQD